MTLFAALWIGIPATVFAVGLALWLSAKDNQDDNDDPDWRL